MALSPLPPFVILNSFQDNKLTSFVIPKQVRDDEAFGGNEWTA